MRVLLLSVFLNLSMAMIYQQSTAGEEFFTKCGMENMVTSCVLKCNEFGLGFSFTEETKKCCCVKTEVNERVNDDATDCSGNKETILLSENRPSSSSSVYHEIKSDGGRLSHESSLAFDGKVDQILATCMATNRDKYPWLQVDLKRYAFITHVKIYNEKNYNELKNATILVIYRGRSSEIEKNSVCIKFEKISNTFQIGKFHCATKTRGNLVRLTMKTGRLVICEMQVFGYYP